MAINSSLVLFFLALLSPVYSVAAEGPGSSVGDTQSRRSQERFSIIDWIRSQQSAIRAQDSKWGRGGSSGRGPYIDISFQYIDEVGTTVRNSTTLGTDDRSGGKIQFYLDNLFAQGNFSRSINIDLGVEGFYSQSNTFTKNTPSIQNLHGHKELGGGLLIRPFGRSTQDTSLALKGGYISIDEAGLWNTTTTQYNLYSYYLGAEAKLYLLLFLGLKADYENILEAPIGALSSKWKMQRFRYGAFIEIFLLNLGAHLFTNEMVLTQNSNGAVTKEVTTGFGLSAALHF